MNKKIAIIGGGAAGMMAAARISELAPDATVVLFEKNPALGSKVVLSGGGRCNVTTGIQDVREVLKRYTRGSKFLTNAMWGFPPAAVYSWFEEHGVPLKTEPDMRVFPQSNDGADVVGVFERLFDGAGADVRLETAVQSVARMESPSDGFSIEVGGKKERVDAVILTTGGKAYRHTGSTGDGYSFAEALGHSLTPLAASLNSFVLDEDWIQKVPGVSFADITLTAVENPQHTARGPIVCTHTGISGPAVFALSAQIAFEEYSKESPLALQIDWLPSEPEQTIRAKIDIACEKSPKKLLTRLLQEWLPKSMAAQLLQAAGIDEDILLAALSKPMRTQVVQQLKRSLVHIVGRAAGSEFVTAGGVDTAEIDPGTMQSRIVPGLFFGGEIMNVDGVTGGFNLQAAWAAGQLAGESAVEYLKKR